MNTVSILNHVLQQATYLKLVVSSTWREPDNRYERTVNNLQDFCRVTGLKRNLFHTDWRTPLIGDGRNRLVECEAWLNEHPEVFKALAIDDNYSDQFKSQSIIKYIKTDPRKGLTANNISSVLNFFGIRTRADYTVVTAGGPMPI